MMPEPKKEKVKYAVLTPIMPSRKIRASGPYTAADLGKLLVARAGSGTVTLTRAKDHEYIRGLRDAHMMDANLLYDMLAKVETVEVTFHEEEE